MSAILLSRCRGPWEESRHFGALAVCENGGRLVFSAGDVGRPVFPRSAIKLIHALPFFMTGAADAFACSPVERALSAASHVAAPYHLEALEAWATRLNLPVEALSCGRDAPLGRHGQGMGLDGQGFGPFHNNNSGKHLGILTTMLHLDEPLAAYDRADHPAMRRLDAVTEAFCDVRAEAMPRAIENCGLPTFALPLAALARGMASWARSSEAAPLRVALAAAPEAFAGARRLGTRLLQASGGTLVVKGGSDGVYCVADSTRGLGYALKIDDGSGEAATLVILESLRRFGSLADDIVTKIQADMAFFQNRFHPERCQKLVFPALP